MDKYWSLLTEALTQEYDPSVKRFPDAGTLDAAATTVAPILPCGGGVPFRVQLSRKKGWRKPDNTVVVARPSPYGNYAGSTRADFERDIAEMSNADRAFFMDRVAELRGKNLACWCALDKPCHADVLLELANHSPSNIQHDPSRDRSEQFGCAGLVQLHDSGVS